MMEGELDPATPPFEAAPVGDFYAAPGQHYVLLPGAPHNFLAPTASGSDCALSLFFFFQKAPTAPLFDCVGDILPLDFTGNPGLAAYLGTTDLWENDGPTALGSAPGSRPPAPAGLADFASVLRRRVR